MKTIDNKGELRRMLDEYGGCVIYGAGLVGTCLIQHLAREKLLSKIVCVSVKSKEKNPIEIMGIPVCELKDMESYKDDYLFIIATMEHLQAKISEELSILNYKHYCGISNMLYTEIRSMMNDFTPDILCKLNKGLENIYENFILMSKRMDELNGIINKIEVQNEISCINSKAFAQYKNIFCGKDIAIVATGPTLNVYKPVKDAIHIGVNTAYKKVPLDFLFVQDGAHEYMSQKFKGIEDVQCKIFMGRFAYGEIDFPEQYHMRENVSDFILEHIGPTRKIYKDICHHPVSGWVSVVFSALHFALYTYPRRIYLVGCDVSQEGYYDGTTDEKTIIKDERAKAHIEGYQMMKEWAQIHYPETEIISINPVGLKGMFKDIYTE